MPYVDTNRTRTAAVLQEMLTENTGEHFLDSGGAYGRHWQRNADKDFDAEPQSWLRAYLYTPRDGSPTLELDVTHSVYHFILDRTAYRPDVDEHFREWCAENGQYPDFSGMEAYAEDFHDEDNPYGHIYPITVNTYNHESVLSQTLQYTSLYHKYFDQWVHLIQIHGGCDVRGGYTDARAFETYSSDSEDPYPLADDGRYSISWYVDNPHKDQLRLDGASEPESWRIYWSFDGGHYGHADGWDERTQSSPQDLWEYPVIEDDEPHPDDYDTLVVVGGDLYLGPAKLEASPW